MLSFRRCLPAGLVLLLAIAPTHGQPKPAKGPAPRVVVALPLGIDRGKTTKVTLRGLNLDGATEVRMHEPKSKGRVVGTASKVGGYPPQMLNQTGDTQLDIEITLPPDLTARAVPFLIVTPGGESKPALVMVNDDTPRVPEKEPNDGFRQAQPLSFPQVVEGKIGQNQDVDVFRFEGKAGQRVRFGVHAARYGSPLDPVLTLYDATGSVLLSADDGDDSADPRLELDLPRDGTYYLALTDAYDTGGPAHVYRLEARAKK